MATAEAFLDSFYSFDVARLEATLLSASPEAIGFAVFYQGWAEGGNYGIVDRMPCETDEEGRTVTCSITVEDDLMKAIDLDFDVTDTFTFTFADRELIDVDLGSDDPELLGQGFDWVFAERPELLGGVCAGFFTGGPTPGECIEQVVVGLEDFRASDEFPGSP